jgi:hypothetical protein
MSVSIPLYIVSHHIDMSGNNHRRGAIDGVEELARLPAFNYYLDESDPDIAILRRQDGSFVAAFSTQGATKEGIVEAAKDDYRALLTREFVRGRDFGVMREFGFPEHR